MAIRRPYVAGSFYPGDPSELQKFCVSRLGRKPRTISAKAIALPHAGYVYSGDTACHTLSQVIVPENVLLIGPDHRGQGSDFSIYPSGQWETPLQKSQVNSALAQKLIRNCPYLIADELAHESEHSLEVLLPLLQFVQNPLNITPIIVGTLDTGLLRKAAEGIGDAFATEESKPLVVISTDMSHYEPDSVTREKDAYALDAIKNLDEKALERVARSKNITMCGFGPVYMLLCMKEQLGITRARLVEYATSAAVSKDYNRVVGYAGFIFE